MASVAKGSKIASLSLRFDFSNHAILFPQAASLAVVGGCVYLLLQSKEILDFEIVPDFNGGNSTAVHFTLILIVITVFGFLFIFTFLGCCGAACTNRCMLGEETTFKYQCT